MSASFSSSSLRRALHFWQGGSEERELDDLEVYTEDGGVAEVSGSSSSDSDSFSRIFLQTWHSLFPWTLKSCRSIWCSKVISLILSLKVSIERVRERPLFYNLKLRDVDVDVPVLTWKFEFLSEKLDLSVFMFVFLFFNFNLRGLLWTLHLQWQVQLRLLETEETEARSETSETSESLSVSSSFSSCWMRSILGAVNDFLIMTSSDKRPCQTGSPWQCPELFT